MSHHAEIIREEQRIKRLQIDREEIHEQIDKAKRDAQAQIDKIGRELEVLIEKLQQKERDINHNIERHERDLIRYHEMEKNEAQIKAAKAQEQKK